MSEGPEFDVIVVGGGPAGSTTASLLAKYSEARILVLERETFPREHVGESQLPPISKILDEMGVWDAVEAAGFPIKVGATYRWGDVPELWDFDFVPNGDLKAEPRPARFVGQRTHTAFQVDRARYDQILLNHARDQGCEVREGVGVVGVQSEGGRIESLTTSRGEQLSARWYVDASGHRAVLRRELGVEVETPAQLKNVAVWDYWDNVEWEDTIGVGGTRVLILSVPFGWIWFIPISETRASVGLVVPTRILQERGQPLEQLYAEALAGDARIAGLLAAARQRGAIKKTRDWSFVAERAHGPNWFLAGEAIGFADPILSAGMTLTHSSGRELAYTLGALLAGKHDPGWLSEHYTANQTSRVRQHIRFADFWYAANGQLTELKEECSRIASDHGFELNPESAWAWLAAGGFADDNPGQVGAAGVDMSAAKRITEMFTGGDLNWRLNEVNHVRVDLEGAERVELPRYFGGEITRVSALQRGSRRVFIEGPIGLALQVAAKVPHVAPLLEVMRRKVVEASPQSAPVAMAHCVQAVEYLLDEGWFVGTFDESQPRVKVGTKKSGGMIGTHRQIRDGRRS